MKTYSARIAFKRSVKKVIENEYFGVVGWKSPTTGETCGPFYIHIHKDTAVEVLSDGKFYDIFPASSKEYFPWSKKYE